MKSLIAVIAITLALAVSAVAQDSMSCHKTDDFTTVCQFSDGRVNVTTFFPSSGDYYSDWYTAAQWRAKEAKESAAKKQADEKANSTAEKAARLDTFCKNNPSSIYGAPETPSAVVCKDYLEKIANVRSMKSWCESGGYPFVWQIDSVKKVMPEACIYREDKSGPECKDVEVYVGSCHVVTVVKPKLEEQPKQDQQHADCLKAAMNNASLCE